MKLIGGFLIAICLGVAGTVSAQEGGLLEEAEAHAQAGNFEAMQRAYQLLLSVAPENVQALNGRATALAWQGRYDEAEQAYADTLAVDPENINAYNGLGYARAWDGDFDRALEAFASASSIEPGNLDARKGEAYVYLWSRDYERAERAFLALANEYPSDTELLVALGQSRLEQGFSRSALTTFDRVIATDPTNDAARMGRVAAFNVPPSFEFGAWFGSTSNADSGLRQLELAYWPNRDTRVAGRYDDSLSLDNPALSRSGGAETLFVGATHRLNDAWVIGGEVGLRQLPDGDQNIYRGEFVWVNPRARVTFGAQTGNHDLGFDDTLTYLGLAVPLGSNWTVELNNYDSEIGADADDEQRTILNAEYRSNAGWSVLVGGGSGSVKSSVLGTEQDIKVTQAVAFIPLFGYHRLILTLRREEVGGESFNIGMVGFTYRMIRN